MEIRYHRITQVYITDFYPTHVPILEPLGRSFDAEISSQEGQLGESKQAWRRRMSGAGYDFLRQAGKGRWSKMGVTWYVG